MDNYRFIKTLNQIALAETQLDTGVPSKIEEDRGFFDGLFGFSEADWYSFGVVVVVPGIITLGVLGLDKLQKYLGKSKDCIKLFGRWLRAPLMEAFNSIANSIFGGPIGEYMQGNPDLKDVALKARELWQKWNTQDGFRQRLLNDVDRIYSSDPGDDIDAIKKRLRECITNGTLDKFVKKLMSGHFVSKFPTLPSGLLDSIMTWFEAFLNNGDLYALSIAVATSIFQFAKSGGEVAQEVYVAMAELLADGFVDYAGVGYTVLIVILTAVLIGLSAFFLAGGTLAGIAAWLSSTASGIISTAAAGAGLSSAAIQRINEIIQQIARQVAPAT